MNRDLQRIWHPFTQARTAPAPLMVRKGFGACLELENGQVILDMISSWWVNLHGHGHPDIARAIYEQALELEQVIFAGFTHEPAEQFAQKLIALLNEPAAAAASRELVRAGTASAGHTSEQVGEQSALLEKFRDSVGQQKIATSGKEPLAHVFYSDNGSTAVEVALKMAFQYWRNSGQPDRTRFICFDGSYHGDTVGAMSVGGDSPFWEMFKPIMFPVSVAPFAATFEQDRNVEDSEMTALRRLRQILEEDCDKFAAIIIEPLVQGAGGMRMCRQSFLSAVCAVAREFDVLVIFDEVMTGFGRTGDYFACTKTNLSPDILCVSKGISGGFLPLSATVCTSRIYDAFLSEDWRKMLVHGHSYTANPLALAAANASLTLLRQNSSRFQQMELTHRRLSEKYLAGNPNLTKPRFSGTIFAVDVDTERGGYYDAIGPRLRDWFLREGFLIRPLGNTVYLLPPYCITDDQLEAAYDAIARGVTSCL